MNFIKNLDYLLEKKEMKKSDLAREINVAPSTISAWYNGKYEKVSLQVLKKLSNYFNVTMDELVNDDLSNSNEITPNLFLNKGIEYNIVFSKVETKLLSIRI